MHFIVQGYPAYAYTGGRPFDPAGRAVVFIHGAAFDHTVWQWQSRGFAHHGWTVLAVDLPAHGRSPGVKRTTIEALGDWIVALLDSASLPKAALVGHSMGSLVALAAARAAPDRVTHLALLGTSLPMPVGDAFTAAARDDHPAALDMEVTWGHARNIALASSPVPGMTLWGASRALNARAHAGVLHADLQACHAFSLTDATLATFGMPTLVLAGLRDQMTPPKAGRAVADRISGARFETLAAGHSMMSEAPHETLAALRRFLA